MPGQRPLCAFCLPPARGRWHGGAVTDEGAHRGCGGHRGRTQRSAPTFDVDGVVLGADVLIRPDNDPTSIDGPLRTAAP